MYFSSKRDFWLGLLIWIPIIAVSFLTFRVEGNISKVIMVSVIIFIGWVWFGTGYYVGEETLKIISGPFRWKIYIKDIVSINETHNPLSSPALSMDRLIISHGSTGFSIVSPKDKDEFIEMIKGKNADVLIYIRKN